MRKAKQRNNLKPKKREVDLIPPQFIIYTDGSADNINEPHYGGSAYIIIDGTEHRIVKEESYGLRYTSNNKAELHAINMAIESLPDNCSCWIFSDSKYAIGVLSHMDRNYEKNSEYIHHFRQLVQRKNITFEFMWIKSHSRHIMNERVDRMAKQAMYEVEQRFKDKENETKKVCV